MCICTLHHVELHYLRSCTIQWLGRADVDIKNPFFSSSSSSSSTSPSSSTQRGAGGGNLIRFGGGGLVVCAGSLLIALYRRRDDDRLNPGRRSHPFSFSRCTAPSTLMGLKEKRRKRNLFQMVIFSVGWLQQPEKKKKKEKIS